MRDRRKVDHRMDDGCCVKCLESGQYPVFQPEADHIPTEDAIVCLNTTAVNTMQCITGAITKDYLHLPFVLYGSPLRLPGPLLDPSPADRVPDPASFAAELYGVMAASRPFPVLNHGTPRSRVDPALSGATHVFLRVDAVKRPLVPPYEGPFQVLSRTSKTFVILKRGKPITVTIDRLKPAYFLPETQPVSGSAAVPDVRPLPASAPVTVALPGPVPPPSSAPPSSTPSSAAPPPLNTDNWPLPTRYGRRPRPPTRLNL